MILVVAATVMLKVQAAPKNNLVCVGDSITAGYGVPKSWTEFLTLKGDSWRVTNTAVSSRTLETMASVADKEVAPLFVPGANNVIVLFGGTNSIAITGKTAAQVHAMQRAYCLAARSHGWRVVVVESLSRTGSTDAKQARVNELLLADHAFADGIVVLPVELTAIGASADRTYFLDGIHPTEMTDRDLIAPAVSAVVNSLGGN